MKKTNVNRKNRQIMRHKRITKHLEIIGNNKFRLVVSKSNNHLVAQIIDDKIGKTLVSSSTLQLKKHANLASAKLVGEDIAKKAVSKKITEVVFDRGGNVYHGQIQALADAAREHGLKF